MNLWPIIFKADQITTIVRIVNCDSLRSVELIYSCDPISSSQASCKYLFGIQIKTLINEDKSSNLSLNRANSQVTSSGVTSGQGLKFLRDVVFQVTV